MNIVLIHIGSLIAGYLCGSIMFASLITRMVTGRNIRDLGNHNPGAANTFKNVGRFWGILAGALDAAKAFIPLLVADRILGLPPSTFGLIGLGAIFGHGFPLYFGFRGGRAAGTLMGIYLYLIPIETLISLAVVPWIVALLIKRDRSYWMPLSIIALGGLASMFLAHPLWTKLGVVLTGFGGLFMNRIQIPLRIQALKEGSGDETDDFGNPKKS